MPCRHARRLLVFSSGAIVAAVCLHSRLPVPQLPNFMPAFGLLPALPLAAPAAWSKRGCCLRWRPAWTNCWQQQQPAPRPWRQRQRAAAQATPGAGLLTCATS